MRHAAAADANMLRALPPANSHAAHYCSADRDHPVMARLDVFESKRLANVVRAACGQYENRWCAGHRCAGMCCDVTQWICFCHYALVPTIYNKHKKNKKIKTKKKQNANKQTTKQNYSIFNALACMRRWRVRVADVRRGAAPRGTLRGGLARAWRLHGAVCGRVRQQRAPLAAGGLWLLLYVSILRCALCVLACVRVASNTSMY